MVTRSRTFTAPAPQRPAGDLLYAAEVTESPTIRFNEATGLMESYNSIATGLAATLPCPAVTLAAPTTSAGSTATTGGTLVPGTYRAIITGINSRGETTGGTERSVTVPAGTNTNTVTFNWSALSGATGYRVYVTNAGAGTEAQYVEVGAVTTYVMTAYPPSGAVSTRPSGAAATPPTTNTAVAPASKSFDGLDWNDGLAFATYTGVVCKAFNGVDINKVREVFEAVESRAVARKLMTTRFIDGGSSYSWDAATDLTPAGGAVTPNVGMAILEGWMRKQYASAPTIHMPYTIASIAAREGGINTMGTRWTTNMGSIVAADAGYEALLGDAGNTGPSGALSSAGELWMFVSGGVAIERGDLVLHGEMERTSNEFFVLVERGYLAVLDGPTAAVRVEVY